MMPVDRRDGTRARHSLEMTATQNGDLVMMLLSNLELSNAV
jgi:hypothetical protein